MIFTVRLVDISVIDGLDLTRGSNVEIGERLRQVFNFLPKEAKIEVANGIVTIDIPDSPDKAKLEADRLHDKATQRAQQGDYRKAVKILERVIELDPANVAARRNLGMAYVELQETDKARDILIEAALLDPKDAWSFVVLGSWQHQKILLQPVSTSPGFKDIVLEDSGLDEFKVLGEFLAVL